MIPVLNVMGAEVCPLPTMLLSTHTGGFGKPEILPVPEEYLLKSAEHFRREKIRFDAVFIGYLGTVGTARAVETLLESQEGIPVLFDPIMGDNGRYYANFDRKYRDALIPLVKKADVILPNLTEAAFLADIPYETAGKKEGIFQTAAALRKKGAENIVITGLPSDGQEVKTAVFEKEDAVILSEEKIPYLSHGTGDLFDGVFVGNYLKKEDLPTCVKAAAGFVKDCLKEKIKDASPKREGVPFERLLRKLI